ncbi:hypothetical protein COCSADRAFT_32600 [Bipolaris sorokiniana ND90Pr]|uniref:Uncharacterized protein n=1 Tax=Cochliobolus sativus (strain ND90Pr / ATCC 201652) TaxID=665912 RepID=M2SRU4_COCSN|nr:uncharacterized protein COCSADRAFT_32600 [Bipolaris sorokiniana ND90Pr]EMD69953.1 hypothetical protein COCSADRAFT_32600 [Bipolaris sorokiniana ND90Pr]
MLTRIEAYLTRTYRVHYYANYAINYATTVPVPRSSPIAPSRHPRLPISSNPRSRKKVKKSITKEPRVSPFPSTRACVTHMFHIATRV